MSTVYKYPSAYQLFMTKYVNQQRKAVTEHLLSTSRYESEQDVDLELGAAAGKAWLQLSEEDQKVYEEMAHKLQGLLDRITGLDDRIAKETSKSGNAELTKEREDLFKVFTTHKDNPSIERIKALPWYHSP